MLTSSTTRVTVNSESRTTAARIRCIDTADESGYRARARTSHCSSRTKERKLRTELECLTRAIDIHYACLYMMIEERRRGFDSLPSHSFVRSPTHVGRRNSFGGASEPMHNNEVIPLLFKSRAEMPSAGCSSPWK